MVGAGTDGFVDVTGETEVELRLPLEVDMEPNKDVPTYPGVVDLGAVGPVIDTHRRIDPPTAAKPKWARRELPIPRTLEYQRWRSEIDARPGKLEEDRCTFGAASQTYPDQHLPKVRLPPARSTPDRCIFTGVRYTGGI